MIPSNVIHRVFRIRYGPSEATAFTIDVDGREYVVSARHALTGFKGMEPLDFFSNGAWTPVDATLVGHASGDIDISVLAAVKQLTPVGLPLPAESNGVIYGQEAFFLGFPYGFMGKYSFGTGGYPLAFVKRATVSVFDSDIFYLDGHNNPGFSGGPVVFKEVNSATMKVLGVVSGYRAMNEPVYYGDAATQLSFRYNTGIIVSYSIGAAVAIARSNPIGYK